jgi:hypothetical protein
MRLKRSGESRAPTPHPVCADASQLVIVPVEHESPGMLLHTGGTGCHRERLRPVTEDFAPFRLVGRHIPLRRRFLLARRFDDLIFGATRHHLVCECGMLC